MAYPALTSTPNWRDHLLVHSAAEAFPLLSGKELKELAGDIKRNGLQTSIIIWLPEDSDDKYLLDGRNGLDALALLGWLAVDEHGRLCIKGDGGTLCEIEKQHIAGGDPTGHAYSFNLHRRHLKPEKKRELIAAMLEANPEKSDRQIGSVAKSDGKTVAAVRAEKEGRAEIPHVGARIDTKGRKQPARSKPKSAPKPKPKSAVEPPPKERVVADVVAPDEELALLRDFAKFVLTRANVGGIDSKDYDEWKALLDRVKAILGGPR